MTSDYQWAIMEAELDPVVGSEQKGRRPVLIVSNEEFNQIVSNLTVLPVTSAKRELYPCEVRVSAGQAGLNRESIIMAHQIRTISKERIGRRLGVLEDRALRHAVRLALAEHLDLT